jgi:hypothetical protein
MNRLCLIVLTGLSTVTVAADKMPLNIKTGLWEVTTHTGVRDDTMLPAGLLDKLTPEQRDRMEERMKARQADAQKTTITKQCVTRDELESGLLLRPPGKSCNWSRLSSTKSKVELRGVCVDQGLKTIATLRIEALSPETTAGSVQFSTPDANTNGVAVTIFKARWIGPFCKAS